MKFFFLFSVILSFSLTRPAEATLANRVKVLMANLGDSITAATFADRSAISRRMFQLPVDGEITPEALLPFLGNKQNKATFSWASGDQIESHLMRLRKTLGEDFEVSALNVAVPGNKTVHLEAQAEEVLKAMRSKRYATLKYVTLMIGANDACGGVSPEAMQENIEKAFAKLSAIEQSEPIRVLVSSIPRIPDLGKEQIRNLVTANGLSCGFLRDRILHFCPRLLRWTSEEDYQAKVAATVAGNDSLIRSVERAKAQYGNLEVAYSDQFYQTEIVPAFLAADCFHPNKTGQAEIAGRLWKQQPWFR